MPLQKIKRWLLLLLISLLILLAGIVGVIQFYVFPHIDNYRGQIEQKLSASLHQQITIASIAIRWRGLAPQVTLAKVTLFDNQHRPALELAKVTTRLSWTSLALLSPSLVNLSIDAPTLVVRRTANGEVFLAGISMSGQGNPAFANWLLSQRRIKVSNASVTWLDEQRQAPPLLLKDLNIEILTPLWQRLLHRHSIHIDTLVSRGTQQRIHVEAVAVGNDVAKPEAWRGELSLRLPKTDLAAWRPWIALPVDLTAGKGNLTATLAFDKLQLQRLAAQVMLNNVAVSPARTSQTFIAKTMSGELRWQRVEQRQMLTLKHFSADIQPGLTLSDANGELQWDQHGHEATLSLKQLALSQSDLLAQWLPADATLTRYLENMVPAVNATKLKAHWLYRDQQLQDYAMTAGFDHLHAKAYEQFPGLQNWAGQLSIKPNAGSLELDTRNAVIELAGLLRWPLPVDQLQGEIDWRNNGQKMLITTDKLHLSNPHIALMTNLEYQVGAAGGDTIQLQIQIERGEAKFASFYYPLVLDQATLHWLDTSIKSGQIKHGEVIVKGRVKDFPYVNAEFHSDPSLGLFRVTAQLDHAKLEYGTDWPQVQDIDALLKFEGKRMDIAVKNATTVGQHITQAQVEIPRLDVDDPILSVKATATGSLEQGIKFVNTSPVKQVAMGFTDSLKATGTADLKLALQIPLNNVDASQFQGEYVIKNGHIAANTQMALPEMSNINGHLKFNEKGLQAQGIQLSLFDNPATLSLTTRPDKSVIIQGSGRITDAALKKLDNNLLTRALHGTTDWKSNVLIQAPNLRLDIRSQLIGMAIDLPEPAKKSADTPANLIIRVRQESNQPEKIAVDYNEWLHANLFRQANGESATITAGEIAINTPARLPTGNGINLRADFPKLNIDEWLPTLNQVSSTQSASPSALALNQVELTAGTLHVFDRNLHQIKLNITPESERLKLQIQSQELAGEANWLSGKPSKLVARLNYLRVPRTQDNDNIAPLSEARRLDISYPELDITAQDFQFGDKQLGSLDLKAFNSGESWVIQRMNITNPDSQLTADGLWRNSVHSPQTQIKFSLNSSNLGKTLQRFQPGGEMVKGGTGSMNGQLGWPGSPHEFAIERLDGNFTMQLDKGQILKVQPGVGRLLGLLSLQSLPRRLTLDFRDLFSEGFAFDKITSTANIRDGILHSDDLFMTGPAAEAKIKGETNLKTETQRLNVRVVPHISDSVSLAALAGGPIVGVAAFVAQKLLKDPLNKISASEYMITGTWDNPQEADGEKKAPSSPAVQPLKNVH